MPHLWTPEQLDIFAAVTDTKDNLLIEALAGAAKTTTLVEIANRLGPGTIAIAFNKRIADEMSRRMNSTVDCRTLNALGHRILSQHLKRRLTVSAGKCRDLAIQYISEHAESDCASHLWDTLGDSLTAIAWAKNHGHVPDAIAEKLSAKCSPLLTNSDFLAEVPEELTDAQRDLCLWTLRTSFSQALEGRIDFSDQLLLPTVLNCMYPIYHNVLVDEAQDLSELNHIMLTKLAKRRIICVGDSRQAIYAFRGAHLNSMSLLSQRFSMTTHHLSVSFRCPEAICDHVRWHVPRIQHWPSNPANPGTIRHLPSWSFDNIPDGSAIICRNNGPLFRLAIHMLKAGRRPNVWGRDIASSITKVIEKLGAPNMRQGDALVALDRYHTAQHRKLRKRSAKKALADRVACARVFLMEADYLGSALTLAQSVFASKGKVDFTTGHKAKGHEWNDVFFLDSHLIGDDPQERNLSYVIATRAKRNLTYILSDDIVEAAPVEAQTRMAP